MNKRFKKEIDNYYDLYKSNKDYKLKSNLPFFYYYKNQFIIKTCYEYKNTNIDRITSEIYFYTLLVILFFINPVMIYYLLMSLLIKTSEYQFFNEFNINIIFIYLALLLLPAICESIIYNLKVFKIKRQLNKFLK